MESAGKTRTDHFPFPLLPVRSGQLTGRRANGSAPRGLARIHACPLELLHAAAADAEPREERGLGGALHRCARVVVDLQHHRVRVRGQVAARLQFDLPQGCQASLLAFHAFRVGPDLAGDAGDLQRLVMDLLLLQNAKMRF